MQEASTMILTHLVEEFDDLVSYSANRLFTMSNQTVFLSLKSLQKVTVEDLYFL